MAKLGCLAVPASRNGKTLALKIVQEIIAALDSYVMQTGHDPEHIIISKEDYDYLAKLCVVTVEPIGEKGFRVAIIGIPTSVSRDLKRGQFIIGKEYTIRGESYDQSGDAEGAGQDH